MALVATVMVVAVAMALVRLGWAAEAETAQVPLVAVVTGVEMMEAVSREVAVRGGKFLVAWIHRGHFSNLRRNDVQLCT